MDSILNVHFVVTVALVLAIGSCQAQCPTGVGRVKDRYDYCMDVSGLSVEFLSPVTLENAETFCTDESYKRNTIKCLRDLYDACSSRPLDKENLDRRIDFDYIEASFKYICDNIQVLRDQQTCMSEAQQDPSSYACTQEEMQKYIIEVDSLRESGTIDTGVLSDLDPYFCPYMDRIVDCLTQPYMTACNRPDLVIVLERSLRIVIPNLCTGFVNVIECPAGQTEIQAKINECLRPIIPNTQYGQAPDLAANTEQICTNKLYEDALSCSKGIYDACLNNNEMKSFLDKLINFDRYAEIFEFICTPSNLQVLKDNSQCITEGSTSVASQQCIQAETIAYSTELQAAVQSGLVNITKPETLFTHTCKFTDKVVACAIEPFRACGDAVTDMISRIITLSFPDICAELREGALSNNKDDDKHDDDVEKTCDTNDDCLEGMVCKPYPDCTESVCMCDGEPGTQVYHPNERRCFDLVELNEPCAVGRQCWQWGQKCHTGVYTCVCENPDDKIEDGVCISASNVKIGDRCTDAANCYYINAWGHKIDGLHQFGLPLATCNAPAANPRCACPQGLKADGVKCLSEVGQKKLGEVCKHNGNKADSCEANLFCKSCYEGDPEPICRGGGQDALRVSSGLVVGVLLFASLQHL